MSRYTQKDWQVCQNTMASWLKGQFPDATEHEIAMRTGIPSDTVLNWLQGKSKPSFEAFSIMLAVFGAPYLEACFTTAPAWIADSAEQERLKQLESQIAALQKERDCLLKQNE